MDGRAADARAPVAVDDGDDELRGPQRRETPRVARRGGGMVNRAGTAGEGDDDEDP